MYTVDQLSKLIRKTNQKGTLTTHCRIIYITVLSWIFHVCINEALDKYGIVFQSRTRKY